MKDHHIVRVFTDKVVAVYGNSKFGYYKFYSPRGLALIKGEVGASKFLSIDEVGEITTDDFYRMQQPSFRGDDLTEVEANRRSGIYCGDIFDLRIKNRGASCATNQV